MFGYQLGRLYLTEAPSIRAALELLSDKEPDAEQGTLIDVESERQARAAAERIKLRLKRTVEDIIEIGRELMAVKTELPHGQFLPWIAAEFEMHENTARNFMQVWEKFGGKSTIIVDFKPTILYALAAPSTPAPPNNTQRVAYLMPIRTAAPAPPNPKIQDYPYYHE